MFEKFSTKLAEADKICVACVQMNSSRNLEQNRNISEQYIREAAQNGAKLIILPEAVNLIDQGIKRQNIFEQSVDPALRMYSSLASELQIFLHVGSLILLDPQNSEKFLNRGFLIDPTGEILCHYDKIHMFDVFFSGKEAFRESAHYTAGEKAISWPLKGLFSYGLTICYDLRFPLLFRRLNHLGAKVIGVPAAFLRRTGKAHWHVLLRARSIENSCWILAAAQCGQHDDGRHTYGHSLMVSPWGEIIAEMGEEAGILLAEIDLKMVDEVRRQIPAYNLEKQF